MSGDRKSERSTSPEYSLPQIGFVRQRQLIPQIIPFGPTTLWNKVKRGQFPAPIKITAWRVEDVRAWLDGRGRDPDAQPVVKAIEQVTPLAPALTKPAPRVRVVIDRAWETQLVREAVVWREAENIRAYVAAVVSQTQASSKPLSDQLLDSAAAALEVANWKDPLPARVAEARHRPASKC